MSNKLTSLLLIAAITSSYNAKTYSYFFCALQVIGGH